MSLRIHPGARADQKHHFKYLQQAGAAPLTLQKLVDAIREAKRKIRENPATWNFVPGSKRVRRVQIANFRIQVVYTILPDGVPLILEFVGPGFQPRWRERL